MFKFWLLVSAILAITSHIAAFNLDVDNFIKHDGLDDSMFGFSVALHKEQQTSWVIVGAPQADTSNMQRNVSRGGAVYRCQISNDNKCHVIPFDSQGNQYNERGEQVDTKSGQWFGATVSSAGVDGPLVACAPRYVFHTMQPRKAERIDPVGTCFVAKDNFKVYTEYSPCRTIYSGYHRQGSCQAGMSAALTKNGDRLFVGAPGSYYWQGQTYSYGLNTGPRDKVWFTGESTATEDDSYLGYSSATGDFNGDRTEGVAVGMPRGGGLLGKVLIFSWNMTNQQNITGEQIGAYFGYSMCVVDVDGDKLDDLIIGAPMFTLPNNEGKYEMGRVYVMFQGKFNKFRETTTRDGLNSRGRFGLSLTSLGDINVDGYGDFAVGAPYDGPQGRGAVYIYHGSPDGPLEKHSQVIFAEDVVGIGPVSTFGFSVSGGIDLDGNMYPDLVVGAYESNKAITFKARPVAVMEATSLFASESKLISLDDKNCTIGRSPRQQVTCTLVNSCLKYNGMNLPTFIEIEVQWILDAKKVRNPRMFFLAEEGKNTRNATMRLYRGKSECRTDKVYIVENIRDKLTPLEVEMKYNMRTNPVNPAARIRNIRALPEPILDLNRGIVSRDSINIQKNCGPDNICIPDLRVSIKTDDRYLLGSKEPLTIEVNIANRGEDAFEAGFYMTVPPGLNFRKVEQLGESRDTPVTCTPPTVATNNTLKCDIGNPLSTGKVARFRVNMNSAQEKGMASSFDFYMEANSTNDESDESKLDNIISKSINIWVETDLTITGVALDPELHYNVSDFVHIKNATKESELGPQIVNMYEIRNNGPATIEEAEIFLLIPHETIAGDNLVYLLNQPETTANIKCDPTMYANEHNLMLDSVLSSKSFLEKQGITTSYGSRQSSYSSGGHGSSSTSSSSFSTSSSSSGGRASVGHSSGGSRIIYSDEEKRRLDAEEELESAGDASFVHRQRAGQVAESQRRQLNNYDQQRLNQHQQQQQLAAHQRASSNSNRGGGSFSHSSSWNSSSHGGGPAITYSASRNRSSVRGEDGQIRVSESSTVHYGGGNAGRSHQSFGQQQAGHSESSRYQSSDASRSSGRGIFQLDDIKTEENVNQDISGLQSRSKSIGGQSGGGGSESSSSSGRRRMMSQQDGEPKQQLDHMAGISGLEKITQGGRGFQTSSLDLGTLSRDNVDNEIRNRGSVDKLASSGHSGSHIAVGGGSGGSSLRSSSSSWQSENRGSVASQHGGGVSGSSYTHTQSSVGDGSGGVADEFDDAYTEEDEYYEEEEHDQHSGGQDNHQTSHSNIQHGSGEPKFKHYGRLTRQAGDYDLALEEALKCNRTNCAVVRCVAGPLEKDSTAWISIRARLVAQTMHLIAPNVPMNLSTMVVGRVSQLPYIGRPQEKPIKRHEVVTTAIPIPEPKPDVVPLWVVVLAACAGVIILLLLIYLLYKCGFFKRNRPSDSQERQPLNRNGAYHGDEHL